MEADKAAFMGKIMAGVTHEIKNVLAIIKESSGLLEDVITLGKEGVPPPRDKLLRTLSRINEQVNRGVNLSSNLNTFAHVSDEQTAHVDLNQAVDQVSVLCQRFARLKGASLHAVHCHKPLVVVTDPLAFQMLLFHCVELLMGLLGNGAVITMSPTDVKGNTIVISAEGKGPGVVPGSPEAIKETTHWSAVQEIAAGFNLFAEAGGPPLSISVGVAGGKR